jgi:hypothetical protein
MPTATAASAPASALQDAVVGSIKQSQELALNSLNAWNELATKAFPISGLDALPFAGAVPETRELVDASFDLAQELLSVQKDFSAKLLDAVAPKKTK